MDKLDAHLERKLFAFNEAHAVTAYLGEARGIETLREAIEDKEIESTQSYMEKSKTGKRRVRPAAK